MNIKNGRINNINKKLIATALAFTLVAIPLTGCAESENFEYSTNEQGQYVASGNVEYDFLKQCSFLVVENSKYNTIEYYIVKENTIFYYSDIFNDKNVIRQNGEENRKILVCDQLGDYLYATNNIKANYTKEEVELILSQLKEEYLKNEKIKVK